MATRQQTQRRTRSAARAEATSGKRKRGEHEHEIQARRSENQPLIDALVDLSNAASQAQNADSKVRFKAASLKKAALALAKLDSVITEGAKLASGPEKVAGVGSGTAYYIDEFLRTGEIVEIESYRNKLPKKVSPEKSPSRPDSANAGDAIQINRAPVLTLWVVVVAERLGFNSKEAHTYGRWISGVFAQAKGRSLGIFEANDDRDEPKAKRRRDENVDYVQVFEHVKIPVVEKNGSRLALSEGKALNPTTVEPYLERAFGSKLVDVKEAMEILANSMSPEALRQHAYSLYEQFRPPWKGWGQKGKLDLNTIRDLAK